MPRLDFVKFRRDDSAAFEGDAMRAVATIAVALLSIGVVTSVAGAQQPLPPKPDAYGGIDDRAALAKAMSHTHGSASDNDKRRYIAAKLVADAVKAGLNDPDSLQWDDLYTNESGIVVCAEYRARNVFNGMVRKYLSVTRSVASETTAAWNKNCSGKGFFSEKYVIGQW
ncbi:MAG: hypothetical protein ABSA66_12440 [Roseiarcus sp.]